MHHHRAEALGGGGGGCQVTISGELSTSVFTVIYIPLGRLTAGKSGKNTARYDLIEECVPARISRTTWCGSRTVTGGSDACNVVAR